jgi:hypothetical protein
MWPRNEVSLLTRATIKSGLVGTSSAVAHLFARESARVALTDTRDDLGEVAAATLRSMHLNVTPA